MPVNPAALGQPAGGVSSSQSQTSQYLIPGAYPAYQQARQGVETGYGFLGDQARGIYGGLFTKAQDAMNNYGVTQQRLLGEKYGQAGAAQTQSLASRGLLNTSVNDSIQRGLLRDQTMAQQNLAEQIGQYKLGVLGQFGLPMAGAVTGAGLAGLGATTGLAGQYLGMVGQQGISTQAGQQEQQQYANPFLAGRGGGGLTVNPNTMPGLSRTGPPAPTYSLGGPGTSAAYGVQGPTMYGTVSPGIQSMPTDDSGGGLYTPTTPFYGTDFGPEGQPGNTVVAPGGPGTEQTVPGLVPGGDLTGGGNLMDNNFMGL